MRIDCPKCAAVFAIDDRLIPAKGVRAQCPRCSSQVVVRPPKQESNSADSFLDELSSPAGGPPSPSSDLSWPGPPAGGEPDPFADLLGGELTRPAPAPARASGPDAYSIMGFPKEKPGDSVDDLGAAAGDEDDPFASLDFGGESPKPRPPAGPPPPPHDPFAALMGESPPRGGGAPPVPARRPPPPPQDRSPPAGAVPASDPFASLAGDSGSDLPGPSLSTGEMDRPAPRPTAVGRRRGATSDLETWRVMRDSGRLIGPIDMEELKDRIDRGDVGIGDKLSRNDDPFRPASGYSQVASLLGRAIQRNAAGGSKGGRRLMMVAAALLVVLVGAVFLLLRPRHGPPASPTADAFQRRVAVWALAVPDIKGTADEAYREGRKLLAEDTEPSLSAAMNEFRKAVVKDPNLYKAAAGFVEAFAIKNPEATDAEAVREAQDVIAHVLTEAPGDPGVQRAYAHLLLSVDDGGGDNVMEARVHAQKAKDITGGDAESLMALGRTYIRHNADIALEYLDQALAKDPALKRAYIYRGMAREKVGRYAAAVADFQKRLELDPEDRTAQEDIARVAASVGDFEQVRAIYQRVLQKHPDDPSARLGLAVLAFQVDGDLERAQRAIDGLVAIQEQLTDELRGRLLGQAAALAREKGELDRADKLVESAQALGVHGAPALYQGALVDLARGEPEKAQKWLPRIQARITDDVDMYLLVGRLHAAAGRTKDALESFSQAAQLGPQRIEPPLFLASFTTREKGIQQALPFLHKAAEVDPNASQVKRLTDYYESSKARLAGLEKPFEDVASMDLDRAIAYSAAGMVLWHRGEKNAALPLFKKTLSVDSLALPALVYTAQAAFEHGEMQPALAAARGAIQSEKFSPIGYFLEGRILEHRAPPEEVLRSYESALEVSPTFPPALERVGTLMLKNGDAKAAETRLLEAVTSDRTNISAKLALFKMGH